MSDQARPRDDRDEVLDHVSEDRRAFVRRLLIAPYIVPIVTSFSLAALSAEPAMARNPNQIPS